MNDLLLKNEAISDALLESSNTERESTENTIDIYIIIILSLLIP